MKYLVGREEKEIVLADRLSVSFIRKEDNETYIDKMPGFRRVLSVADGNVVVSHEGESVENAKAGTDVIIESDGSAKIFGKFHGICLSAREDIPCHTETVDILKERKALELPEEAGRGGFVQVLTASGGYAVVTFEGDSLMLENGETLAVSFDGGEAYDIGVMGQGRVMVSTFPCKGTFEGTEVSVAGAAGAAGETGEKAEEAAKQEDVSPEDKARKLIKEKKASRRKISLKGATFADFITALKISSTNNSLGRRVSRFRKENWLDPESPTGYLPSANTPYIIQWHAPYFFGKYISFFSPTEQNIPSVFSAGSAPSADDVVNVYGNNTMHTGTVMDAYLLEPDYGPSGAWLREAVGTNRMVLPFECFIRANEATTTRYRILRRGAAPDDTPTGWEVVMDSEPMTAITVYTLTGIPVARYDGCSFAEAARRLNAEQAGGIYILRSEKESVKLMIGGQ